MRTAPEVHILNTWPSVDGDVWKGLGVTLLEAMPLGEGFEVSKGMSHSQCALGLLAVWDVNSRLLQPLIAILPAFPLPPYALALWNH